MERGYKSRPRTKNGLGRVPAVGGVPRYRRRGRRASPATPPPTAAFAATSRLRRHLPPSPPAAASRRQPPPTAGCCRMPPLVTAKRGPSSVVACRPSSVFVRRLPSPTAVARVARCRPLPPVADRRRPSPTAAEVLFPPSSTCAIKRLTAGTLCDNITVTFLFRSGPTRPHTATAIRRPTHRRRRRLTRFLRLRTSRLQIRVFDPCLLTVVQYGRRW